MPSPSSAPARPTSTRTLRSAPRRTELDALAATRRPDGVWHVGGQELKAHQPRQGPVPAPRGRGRAARDQARAHRLLRADRAGDAPAPRRPAAQPPALPQRREPARASGRRTSRPTAPSWLTLWHETGFRERDGPRPQRPPRRRRSGHAVLARATRPRSRSTPGPPRCDDPWRPTFALIDIDPGSEHDLGARPWSSRASTGPRSSTSASAPTRSSPAAAGIQAWIPVERGRYTYARHLGLGRDAVAGGRRDGAGPRVVGVGEGGPRRPGAPRLHAERADQDARRAVRRPAAARARPSRRRSRWDELDDPDLRPDRWTIRTVAGPRGARSATCGPRSPTTTRSCRRSEPAGRAGRPAAPLAGPPAPLAGRLSGTTPHSFHSPSEHHARGRT